MSNNFLRCRDPWKAECTGDIQGRAPSDYTFAFSRRCVSARTHTCARMRARAHVDRPATGTGHCWTFWGFRNRNGSSRRAFDARFATGVPPPPDAISIVQQLNDFSCYFVKIIFCFSERIPASSGNHLVIFHFSWSQTQRCANWTGERNEIVYEI